MAPQTEQIFGRVQVASVQLCPRGAPSVTPQEEQVFGSVQVASAQRCRCPQAQRRKSRTSRRINTVSFFICLLILSFVLRGSAASLAHYSPDQASLQERKEKGLFQTPVWTGIL